MSSNTPPDAAVQQPDKRPIRSGYPAVVSRVDNGKLIGILKNLRQNCQITPPNEIYLALNPAVVVEAAEAQFARPAQRIEGWRNSLILVPIMVTWISLGLAGLAYSQSITFDPSLIGKPFLQQWSDGFTALKQIQVWQLHLPLALGTWRYFSFGDVALLDFLLFVILFMLTVRAHAIEVSAAKEAQELGEYLREECDILREHSLARSLGNGAGGDAPEWAVLVNTSIEKLGMVLTTMTTSLESFHALLKDDREVVNRAFSAVDNLNGIYDAGRTTYEKLDVVLTNIDKSFDKLAESQYEAVRSLDGIREAVVRSSDAVDQLTRPFATVGVSQLAKDTFNTLHQVQSQQHKINDALAKQFDMASNLQNSGKKPAFYRWWDIRRFFF